MTNLVRLFRDESGATAIEYGLIACLIVVGIIAGASSLGNNLSNTFTNIAAQLKLQRAAALR
jgi:pilus assembly protein Flp/PilA